MGKTKDTFKKVFEVLFVDKKDENEKYRQAGLSALYRKELADQIQSRRFLIVLLMIAVTGVASVYSAGLGIQSTIQGSSSAAATGGSTFLSLFTTSGGTLPSFVSFLSFLGPIVGLAMGFDAINGERSRRTLTRLVSQPIYRDSVINGKFLAGLTVISIMVFSLGLIFGSMGVIMIGVPPSSDDLIRILLFLVYTTVYISLWLGISILFSLIFRHAATSALSGISVWVFFSFFLSLLANVAAGAAYPVSDSSTTDVVLNNYNFAEGINRISPTTLYSESVSTILDPSVRTLGPVLNTQVDRAVVGPLPIDQSLLLVWPHLVGLLAITLICFAISYVIFMRQEIRTNS